jgi:plasmid stabilization system protein ParE
MRIRWTQPAAQDLTNICDHLEEHDAPATARRVALVIYKSVSSLQERQLASKIPASWSAGTEGGYA